MEMPGFTICRRYLNHLLVCVISLLGGQSVFETTVSGNQPEIIVDASDLPIHDTALFSGGSAVAPSVHTVLVVIFLKQQQFPL